MGKIDLAGDGKTDAVIVVADDTIPTENTAARELQLYLKTVTGAELSIVSPNQVTPKGTRIFVGPTSLPEKLQKSINWSSLGEEGIVMKTVGTDLVLAGGRPRGTIYAVYTFLEDVIGCRWWAPNESTVPKNQNIIVDNLNTTHLPGLIDRTSVY